MVGYHCGIIIVHKTEIPMLTNNDKPINVITTFKYLLKQKASRNKTPHARYGQKYSGLLISVNAKTPIVANTEMIGTMKTQAAFL